MIPEDIISMEIIIESEAEICQRPAPSQDKSTPDFFPG